MVERSGNLFGTYNGLLRYRGHLVHRLGQCGGTARLLGHYLGDGLNKFRQPDGGQFDLTQGLSRLTGRLDPLRQLLCTALQRRYDLVSFALDGVHDMGDALGGLDGVPGEMFHLCGDDGSVLAHVAGFGSLYRDVEGENPGMISNVSNAFPNLAHFVGVFLQVLDTLGGVPHLDTHALDTLDSVLHCGRPVLRIGQGLLSYGGREGHMLGQALDRGRKSMHGGHTLSEVRSLGLDQC